MRERFFAFLCNTMVLGVFIVFSPLFLAAFIVRAIDDWRLKRSPNYRRSFKKDGQCISR